jgi:RNA polymerase sigma-70 factor (ECF subfamily)
MSGMTDRRRRFEAEALPHLDAATNLARWLARPPLDADDIVQEAMLRAWRAFDTLRGSDVKPWLLTIVRNCFLTAAGKAKSGCETALPDDDAIADAALIAADDPERAAMAGDAGRAVDAMLAALPEPFREVLVLREMEDMSYAQIAQVTGVPVGTVMSRLARGRALLRDQWLRTERSRHVLQ